MKVIVKPLWAFLLLAVAMILGTLVATPVKMYPSAPLIFAMYVYFFVLDTGLIFLYLRTLRNRKTAWVKEGLAVGVLWIILMILEIILLDVVILGFEWRLLVDSWPSYVILIASGVIAGLVAEARWFKTCVSMCLW